MRQSKRWLAAELALRINALGLFGGGNFQDFNNSMHCHTLKAICWAENVSWCYPESRSSLHGFASDLHFSALHLCIAGEFSLVPSFKKDTCFFNCNLARLHKSVPCICHLLLWWLGSLKTIAFLQLDNSIWSMLQGWHRHTSHGRCVCDPWLPDANLQNQKWWMTPWPQSVHVFLCSDWPLPPTSLGPSPHTRQHRCMGSPDSSASFHAFVFFSKSWSPWITCTTFCEAPVFFGGGYVSLKDWYRHLAQSSFDAKIVQGIAMPTDIVCVFVFLILAEAWTDFHHFQHHFVGCCCCI